MPIRHLPENLGIKISKMCKKNPSILGNRLAIFSLITAVCLTTTTVSPILADEPINISIQPNEIHDVRAQVEYDGAVVVFSKGSEDEQDKETLLPLEVRAQFNFEQQCVNSSRHAVRHYSEAAAEITIDGKSQRSSLKDPNKNVRIFLAAERSISKPILFASEIDILEQSEVELLTTPFDFITLPKFFQNDDAVINEAWQPDDQDIVNVLAIDRLYTNNVKLTVKKSTARQSKIYITGAATGEVDGEDISVTLSGIAVIDKSKKLLQSLRVNIQETRGAGQIAPGFEGTVKVDIRTKPKSEIETIPAPIIARVGKFRQQKLAWKPDNSFQLFFDPRWRLITNEDQAAVMRLIDQGDLLAQCNIVQLPNRTPGNLLKLDDFREEVAKMIDGSEAQVVSAKQSKTDKGLNILQVEIYGEEEDVEIRWLYYHVAHEDGRRLTFVFTVEEEVYDRFTHFGQSLVESVQFKKQERSASAKSPQTKRK